MPAFNAVLAISFAAGAFAAPHGGPFVVPVHSSDLSQGDQVNSKGGLIGALSLSGNEILPNLINLGGDSESNIGSADISRGIKARAAPGPSGFGGRSGGRAGAPGSSTTVSQGDQGVSQGGLVGAVSISGNEILPNLVNLGGTSESNIGSTDVTVIRRGAPGFGPVVPVHSSSVSQGDQGVSKGGLIGAVSVSGNEILPNLINLGGTSESNIGSTDATIIRRGAPGFGPLVVPVSQHDVSQGDQGKSNGGLLGALSLSGNEILPNLINLGGDSESNIGSTDAEIYRRAAPGFGQGRPGFGPVVVPVSKNDVSQGDQGKSSGGLIGALSLSGNEILPNLLNLGGTDESNIASKDIEAGF